MEVNIYGFQLTRHKKLTAISISNIFEAISIKKGNMDLGKHYKCAVADLPTSSKIEFLAGVIIKFRDAKAFTRYTNSNGKMKLVSELLGDKDKLAELSFFVMNKNTGAGLITHYYTAPSIINFHAVINKVLRSTRKEILKGVTRDKSNTEEQKALVKDGLSGDVKIEQICRTENLKKLIKSMKLAKTCEITLKSIKTSETLFRGFTQNSERQTIKFHLTDTVSLDEIADEAEILVADDTVKELKVFGKDEFNKDQTYKKTANAMSFNSFDYDTMFSDMNFSPSDFADIVDDLEVIKILRRTCNSVNVRTWIK